MDSSRTPLLSILVFVYYGFLDHVSYIVILHLLTHSKTIKLLFFLTLLTCFYVVQSFKACEL